MNMNCLLITGVLLASVAILYAQPAAAPWSTGDFSWISSGPLISPRIADFHSIKDPSAVFADGKWHLFTTVRGAARTHAIAYSAFSDWNHADTAAQEILPCHPGYFCAPQVFYFTPHKKWYLICQASDPSWTPNYQAAFATSSNIADPRSWSALNPLFAHKPQAPKAWLDFWVICDEQNAHLFFTSLDGKMWRSQTALGDFPSRWSEPVVALQGDIFEASHTYRIAETGPAKYLTIVEAQNGAGWRYYKAYVAERLDGEWRPLAADRDHAFASMANVKHPDDRWTDVVSHVELLRSGNDETLEVDPANLRMVYQGVLDKDRAGKNYGQIPWRLGLLTLRPQ